MSDPAKTQEEIEDVLASIRRLVSDNAKAPETPLTGAGRPSPEPVEALVLSPSFRVEEPEDASGEATDIPEGEAEYQTEAAYSSNTLLGGALQLGDPIDDTAGDVEAAQADWEPEDRLANFDIVGDEAPDAMGSDDEPFAEDESISSRDPDLAEPHFAPTMDAAEAAPMEEADLVKQEVSQEDLDDLRRLDGAEDAAEDFEPESGDENWPGEGAESALLSLVARRDQPDLVDEDDAWNPDAEIQEDPDAMAEFDREIANVVDDGAEGGAQSAADIAETAGDALAAEGAPLTAMETGTYREVADAPSDEVAGSGEAPVFEGVVSLSEASQDDAEDHAEETGEDDARLDPPDIILADGGDVSTPVFSRRPHDEDPSAAALSSEDEVQDSEPNGDVRSRAMALDLTEADDGILDEDTLREIIADVVREELQGVLGQRITRNVRKMVRREIRLALAAEELD